MSAAFLKYKKGPRAHVYEDIAHSPSLNINFQTKLHILSNAANTNNAFLYNISNHKHESFGPNITADELNWAGLYEYLNNSLQDLEIIDSPVSGVFASAQYSLVLSIVKDERVKEKLLLGCYIPISATFENTSKEAFLTVLEDIKDTLARQQSIIDLQQTQARHQQISELNQDFICVKDRTHKIIYANEAMLSTFPENLRTKVLGNTDLPFYEPDVSARIVESDLCALEKGEFQASEQITLANGHERILETSKKSFVAPDGNTYIMSVSKDVTQKEILINDLKRSNSDLDNFAYVASHDLKAPLNVIKRLVTWVGEDCKDLMPADSKEDLSLVLNRVDRMGKLLNDLLNYSRIGKDYHENTKVNLKEAVVELLSLIDLPMGFVVNCDNVDINVPIVPFNVVMLNLINNAIKHHDSGNAKIVIKAKKSAKGAIISVLDNGPGIEAKNRERIFQLFETLRPRDEVEGSGMGLSVVKKIVEHYGGTIGVEDNAPRGTKFVVNWPVTNIALSVRSTL